MPSALTSSSDLIAPKVLPGCGNVSRTELATEELSLAPFGSALLPLLQPAHYGIHDLLACTSSSGSACVIFVYDMNSMQLVQTLQGGHTCPVTTILWKPPKLSFQQHRMFLLSGDQGGSVLLWDVAEGVVISRLCVPCTRPIQILSLLSEQHLLVITNSGNSYVMNAHLVDAVTLPPAPLPLRCREGIRPPARLTVNKLSPDHTAALLMGDRARIISHLDPTREAKPTARDLIYDSEEGEVTVVDAFFSEAVEEVLYFARPKSVGSYDWKVGMVLDEQILWTRDGVEFVRIFASSANSLEESAGCALPLLYSFTTDQRLAAWYTKRTGRFAPISVDVRGARLTAKGVATVTQSEGDSTQFAVLFNDGSIAKWAFSVRCCRWRLTHYYSCVVQRPTCFCRAGTSNSICCAMESGHVAVVDAKHSAPLKRVNLVYSGGTRIALLCPHKHDDAVWVVSNRVVDGRNQHQVSLLNVRSGEVVRVLRKPSSTAELTKVKDASVDPSSTYLLLSFWNGTFEVWNTDDNHLLHIHTGLGVCSVSWAPASLRRCLTGVQGSPQLLSIIFSEGTMSLWSVYKDRCIVSRDAVPLLNPSTIEGGSVQCVTVGVHLVVFDSTGVGFAIGAKGTRLSSYRLKDAPPAVGAVRCISGNTPTHLSTSSLASFQVFTRDTVTVPAGTEAGLSGESDSGFVACAAVVFDDYSFGVWNVATGERLGLSTSPASAAALRNVTAAQVLWIGELVAVLCQGTGNVYLIDKQLRTVNSSVRARALRRPMQTPAFLLPTQRTHLQSTLELMLPQAAVARVEVQEGADCNLADATAGNVIAEALDAAPHAGPGCTDAGGDVVLAASSSLLSNPVTSAARPCRGPFGQLIDDSIQSLQGEIALYRATMLPRDIARHLDEATARRDTAALAFWTARWFGQREKQRFWALAHVALRAWERPAAEAAQHSPDSGSDHCAMLTVSAKPSAGVPGVLLPTPGQRCDGSGGMPFFLADPFSVSCAPSYLVRENCLALSGVRARALQRTHNPSVDDGKARLYVARDFLKLAETTKAVDVLLECGFESPEFNKLSTLALAAAAGAAVRASGVGGNGGGPAQTSAAALFTLSTKRAGAMLLAAGAVDAAVEKFLLAGEYDEACRALESQGRWFDAAALTKATPLSPGARKAILQRWAQQSSKYDTQSISLAGPRILASQGMLSEALEALALSTQFTDVAGILAVKLSTTYLRFSDAAGGGAGALSAPPASILFNVLADYSHLLSSVGNKTGEAHVLDLIGKLKMKLRETSR